jgi:hypothetical protein
MDTIVNKIKENKNWLIAIIAIVFLFLFRECSHTRSEDSLVSKIANYSDSVKVEKLKNGALIYTNTSLALNTEKQLKAMSAYNDTIKQMFNKFKSVSNVTNVTNQFFAGKDTIKFETQIPCNFAPFKVRRSQPKAYQFVGTIGQNYFAIDSLSIPDSMTLIHGRKKVGFMKHDYAVSVTHSNPYIKTSALADYKYVPKKEWYERTWVHIVAGALIETGVRKGANILIEKYIPNGH